jgi:hypothetical protein
MNTQETRRAQLHAAIASMPPARTLRQPPQYEDRAEAARELHFRHGIDVHTTADAEARLSQLRGAVFRSADTPRTPVQFPAKPKVRKPTAGHGAVLVGGPPSAADITKRHRSHLESLRKGQR